ncbi:AraC family transcriptional regulator [Tardiphaga alba]|uniref:AraC family transcriptional regulator n=1 Tax=Tardiphaga alba TaxID=340268 RepID=UPI001BA851E4|nr:AraC family transcriptional regulator [Tardiphaga alba]
MTTLRSAPLDLPATVQWIEHHLDTPLSVEVIAEVAGLSPYHFSRLFSARMGRGVMAHVRGRRLVRAAQRLATDPELRLIDLAVDCGFDSQEAFTRAFSRTFGVAPGRFRRGFSVTPIEGQYPMTMPETDVTLTQLPELATLEAFTVAGPQRRFDEGNKAEIPQLWSQMMGALPFAGQAPEWTTYGVVWNVDRAEGHFDYLAGVGVADEATLPAGFSALRIPAGHYAVFRITLNGGPVHQQLKSAMARIWGELVPAAGLNVAGGQTSSAMTANSPQR